jgi:hypothetical protein
MTELIVVCVVCFIFAGVWIALCIENEKSIIKGVLIAVGLPLMVISMISLFVYVSYCFYSVLS